MKIGNDWDIVLKDVFESEDFRNLILRVNEEYRKSTCFPIKQEVFNAIKLTPYKDVKVVMPKWLEFDNSKLTGKINALPQRDDIDLNVQEHLIIELYSK